MSFQVPSKAYVFGEYSSLAGGPAVIYSGPPFFRWCEDSSSQGYTFHPASLAGKLQAEEGVFVPSGFWEHPFPEAGLGRSGAEILLCLHCSPQYQTFLSGSHDSKIWWTLKKKLHGSDHRFGSGYDWMSQTLRGWVGLWEGQMELRSLKAWPFSSWGWYFLSQGVKLPTHEHLAELAPSIPQSLHQESEKVWKAFWGRDEREFLNTIQRFRHSLQALYLEHPRTFAWLEELATFPGFVFGKGCGALGVDFVFILVSTQQVPGFEKALRQAFPNAFLIAEGRFGWVRDLISV